jgi:DNA mismatch endonuclease (patch repair protein)
MPETNQDYWIPKLIRNKQRDAENIQLLESQGWTVIVVWECELKKKIKLQKLEDIYTEIMKHIEG